MCLHITKARYIFDERYFNSTVKRQYFSIVCIPSLLLIKANDIFSFSNHIITVWRSNIIGYKDHTWEHLSGPTLNDHRNHSLIVTSLDLNILLWLTNVNNNNNNRKTLMTSIFMKTFGSFHRIREDIAHWSPCSQVVKPLHAIPQIHHWDGRPLNTSGDITPSDKILSAHH